MLQIYRTSSLYLQAVYRGGVTGAGCTGSPLRTAAAALGADPGMVAGPRVAYAAAKYAGLPAAPPGTLAPARPAWGQRPPAWAGAWH
jgi:hypothetical protein